MKKTAKEINDELNSLIRRQAYLRNLLKETIEEEMQKAIDESAEQQNIKRISQHIAIIRYSDLIGNPWSLQFHDWKVGGELLMKWLDRIEPSKWVSTLEKLYNERKEENRVDLVVVQSYGGIRIVDKQPISAEFVKRILEKLSA